MPTITPSNNLTHVGDIKLHKFNPFQNYTNAELVLKYFSMIARFILLTVAGVVIVGLLFSLVRYRSRVFRQVKNFVRMWGREIILWISALACGRRVRRVGRRFRNRGPVRQSPESV